MKNFFLYLITGLLLISCSSQFKLSSPQKTPVQNSAVVQALIEEGIRLHDQGNYDGAIQKYTDALELNKDNPEALSEIAYSYFAKGDYQASLLNGQNAAKYKSDYLNAIYVLIGSNLDVLGKPKQAIQVYNKVLEAEPNDYNIHYNLAVTYSGLKENRKAIQHLKKSVTLNPLHASSHLVLATLYYEDSYRIPALLAFARFLILEPNSGRTEQALNNFQHILMWGISKESDNQINIVMPETSPDYDGDFRSIEMFLSLFGAAQFTENNENNSPIENIQTGLGSVFSMLSKKNEEEAKIGFVWEYYVPYFIELYQKDFTQPFVYHIFQLAQDEKIQAWITENQDSIQSFLDWSNNYQFE